MMMMMMMMILYMIHNTSFCLCVCACIFFVSFLLPNAVVSLLHSVRGADIYSVVVFVKQEGKERASLYI